ncbi:hypothetical protein J6590_001114 [Homalodisca vitripennis]|nr:hypothetical protein J6590_001114 [Homalodisca vitripennis]
MNAFRKQADIMYGRASGNGRKAKHQYQTAFLGQIQPSYPTVLVVYRCVVEPGSKVLHSTDRGTPRVALAPHQEENVLQTIEEDPI